MPRLWKRIRFRGPLYTLRGPQTREPVLNNSRVTCFIPGQIQDPASATAISRQIKLAEALKEEEEAEEEVDEKEEQDVTVTEMTTLTYWRLITQHQR